MTQLSNAEFAQAFSDLAWHHAPEGYYDDLEKKMKAHPLVGREAIVTVPDTTIFKRRLKVVRADDDRIIFRLGDTGELIISGDGIDNLVWV